MAAAHLFAGRFETASSLADNASSNLPGFLLATGVAAASHTLAGRTEEGRRAMAQLHELNPSLRISNLKDWLPIRRAEDLATFADGLRRAGLPE
jgi:hypothetical protein